MFHQLTGFLDKPQLYASGTNQFWNDEHISQFVLESHLNPSVDAASRKPEFMDKSVRWIARIAPPSEYRKLLDLGCGPGLYAERFHRAGYAVTGMDFSKRSIAYAKEQAAIRGGNISYLCQDYLTIDYDSCFDVIALIYCDFGVLSTQDRAALARRIYRGLKPGGKFILDVFTPVEHQDKKETRDWQYQPNSGFWSDRPHLCLNSFYRYDEDTTVLRQTVVMDENGVECYNIWEHCFTKEELLSEARAAGFTQCELYGDVSGKPFDENGNMICGVFTK